MAGNEPNLTEHEFHRILIVDDEEIVLVALSETLKRERYDVVISQSAVDALDLLRREQFSVVLTDQMMPVMTGLEFLGHVKQIQPDATRILITAVLSLSTVIDAINKGEIYRFVVKPWLREELLATMKNAVQRYELICRNAILQATTLAMNERLTHLNRSLEQQVKQVAEQKGRLETFNQALSQNLNRSVELCLKTMQTFYPTLGTQSRRAYRLCRALAQSLELSPEDQQILEIGAWLHDIGLVGVPRELIKKWQQAPHALSESERALIEQHPALGEELIAFADHLSGVGKIIRAHHERFDGGGYPDGLRGDQIPWLARLLAVAVSYASSPYPDSEAAEAVKIGSGRGFDPEAVRAFIRCLPKAVVPRSEREVLLAELKPGMVLSRGIYTSGGVLLLPEGQMLSQTYIEKLRNHHRLSPIHQALLVYC